MTAWTVWHSLAMFITVVAGIFGWLIWKAPLVNEPEDQRWDDARLDTIRDELSHLRNEGVL